MISFDATGSGDPNNLVEMDEWGLIPYSEENTDANEFGDVFTYQDPVTGLFSEEFTLRVNEGRNSVDGISTPFPPFYVDTILDGLYVSDDEIYFNSGFITMYDDNQYVDKTLTGVDRDFDDGIDTKIAELTLRSALTSELTGSLLGANDLGMKIDLEFVFDYVNPNYFGADEVDLVGKSWLLAFVGGRIDQENIWTLNEGTGDETLLIEWDLPNMQAEFEAIPEPTTLLLFGTGLLGLAAFGRKKFMNKS